MPLTEKEYADKLGVACPNCDKAEGVELGIPKLEWVVLGKTVVAHFVEQLGTTNIPWMVMVT